MYVCMYVYICKDETSAWTFCSLSIHITAFSIKLFDAYRICKYFEAVSIRVWLIMCHFREILQRVLMHV